MSFIEGMRLLAGMPTARRGRRGAERRDGRVEPCHGGAVARRCARRSATPGRRTASADPGDALKGTLRPYQRDGVAWMRFLTELGLGACLADDMGLGKTIQVLALLLLLAKKGAAGRTSSWSRPRCSATGRRRWRASRRASCPSSRTRRSSAADIAFARAIAQRGRRRGHHLWHVAAACPAGSAERSGASSVLDEAQAIKNPDAKQTRAVKALRAKMRLALTGTPVENRLVDLWSLFDFLCPGLLGAARAFRRDEAAWPKRRAGYAPLRQPRAPVHPAAAEERPPDRRRPARQDRGARLLPAHEGAGDALRQGGRRPGARDRHPTTASSGAAWSSPI